MSKTVRVYVSELKALYPTDAIEYHRSGKTIGPKAGIYALWGGKDLANLLAGHSLRIHAGAKVSPKREVRLFVDTAMKAALHRSGPNRELLWSYYVGKTADYSTRHASPAHRKIREGLKPAAEPLDITSKLFVSFIECNDWADRFFLENAVIAAFRPILNTQPER